MRTVGHVALFLALHSNTLWDKPRSPPWRICKSFVLDGAAPYVTLVTVVLGQGTIHPVAHVDATFLHFFLATTSVMAEESMA